MRSLRHSTWIDYFSEDHFPRGWYPDIGARVTGRVTRVSRVPDETVECLIEFPGGLNGILAGDDLAWAIENPEDNARCEEELHDLARSFLEKELRVVVINISDDGTLRVGRKHDWGDPFSYLAANPTLIFHGVIRSVGEDVARVLMDVDWKNLGYDVLSRVVGRLRRADCPDALWKELRVGMRVRLGLGDCDFDERELQFCPKP